MDTPGGRVSRTMLRSGSAWSPTQGVLVGGASPVAAARAVLEVVTGDAVISHSSAARLLEIPLPGRWDPLEPVHVTVRPPRRAPRRRGVVGHSAARLTVVSVQGVPCTSLAQTWAQLAGVLEERDLVAAADAVLGRTCPVQGQVSTELLLSMLPAGARGARVGRVALELADGGAASAPESCLRLLVLGWGVPKPEVNAHILDGDGQWLARGDLVWFEQKVVVEYEGDHHRTDRRQWQHDIARVRLLEATGWTVIRAAAQDLRRPAQLRQALLAALARRS